MYPVRNSVKAIIIKNDKLLCIRKSDNDGYYYLLPGGGQEKNETFIETVKRECFEEIGAEIKVLKFLYIREYIGKNHEFKNTDNNHQVEFMFECELVSEPNTNNANNIDDGQNGIEWIDINKSNEYRVYPKILLERIKNKENNLITLQNDKSRLLLTKEGIIW